MAAKPSTKDAKKIKIKLVRSVLGRPEKHRKVVKALGLTKTNSEVEQFDTPIIRGMINTIPHLITVTQA